MSTLVPLSMLINLLSSRYTLGCINMFNELISLIATCMGKRPRNVGLGRGNSRKLTILHVAGSPMLRKPYRDQLPSNEGWSPVVAHVCHGAQIQIHQLGGAKHQRVLDQVSLLVLSLLVLAC